jgi:hypothetical protein
MVTLAKEVEKVISLPKQEKVLLIAKDGHLVHEICGRSFFSACGSFERIGPIIERGISEGRYPPYRR